VNKKRVVFKKGIDFASILTKHPFMFLDFDFFTIFVGHFKKKIFKQ
jgi:hypothetical protein